MFVYTGKEVERNSNPVFANLSVNNENIQCIHNVSKNFLNFQLFEGEDLGQVATDLYV